MTTNNNSRFLTQSNLTCYICNDTFHQPKLLPCIHSFCASCLREFVFSRTFDTVGHFPCPLCRVDILIPPGGLDDIPDNYNIIRRLNAAVSDSKNVSAEHAQVPQYRQLVPGRSPTTDAVEYCFGQYGTGPCDLAKPVGLAVSRTGYVVVSDQRDNRILVYDGLQGCIKKVFAVDHEINNITFTDHDTIIVTNTRPGKALAVEYTLTGDALRQFGNFNRLAVTHGIALLSAPFQVVLSSAETSSIYVFNGDGRAVQNLSSRRKFGQPYHLASNSRNDVIVSDRLNHVVKVFDRLGKYKREFGGIGNGRDCLYHPLGVCVDDRNNVIVADSGNRRVKVFSVDGKSCSVVVNLSSCGGAAPQNVALARAVGRLVVLVKGHAFAEIRVYPYTSGGCPRLSVSSLVPASNAESFGLTMGRISG